MLPTIARPVVGSLHHCGAQIVAAIPIRVWAFCVNSVIFNKHRAVVTDEHIPVFQRLQCVGLASQANHWTSVFCPACRNHGSPLADCLSVPHLAFLCRQCIDVCVLCPYSIGRNSGKFFGLWPCEEITGLPAPAVEPPQSGSDAECATLPHAGLSIGPCFHVPRAA